VVGGGKSTIEGGGELYRGRWRSKKMDIKEASQGGGRSFRGPAWALLGRRNHDKQRRYCRRVCQEGGKTKETATLYFADQESHKKKTQPWKGKIRKSSSTITRHCAQEKFCTKEKGKGERPKLVSSCRSVGSMEGLDEGGRSFVLPRQGETVRGTYKNSA